VKLGDRTYKNHLDGYNQMDLLLANGPSKRREVFYFGGPNLGAIRIDDFKFQFYQQPWGWPGEKTTTDMPTAAPGAILHVSRRSCGFLRGWLAAIFMGNQALAILFRSKRRSTRAGRRCLRSEVEGPPARIQVIMSFEFGIFLEFPRGAGQTDAEVFTQSFAQVDAAERWGLDVIWIAEVHFLPDRSIASAPLLIASAIATQTRRLKIGIAVQVLPLCHPLRLAEEVATLDHISNGRVILGVGRSSFPHTYEAYGVPYGESRERFAEVLDILRRSWSDERFSFEGRFHNFQNVTIVPRPLQKPYPPLRIAATSADTYRAIGAMGLPVFVAVRLGTFEELGPDIAAYRQAYKLAGHVGQGEVYLRVPIYVGRTETLARADPEQSIMQFYRTLGLQLEGTASRPGVRQREQRAEWGQTLQTISYEDALRNKVIVGTPEFVAMRLRDLTRNLGLNGVLAEVNCGGLLPTEKVLRSLQLMCEEVAPYFR
jgi:alkanesulfonate monooxygenase SsuD/methylene tetrahydromethanopterin reductase-like flavin-dependent oxidoreductase (luciferase family)